MWKELWIDILVQEDKRWDHFSHQICDSLGCNNSYKV